MKKATVLLKEQRKKMFKGKKTSENRNKYIYIYIYEKIKYLQTKKLPQLAGTE